MNKEIIKLLESAIVLLKNEEERNKFPKAVGGKPEYKNTLLGITPQFIYKEQRVKEINDAIRRYSDTKKEIPLSWLSEQYELDKWLMMHRRKSEKEQPIKNDYEVIEREWYANVFKIIKVRRLPDNEIFCIRDKWFNNTAGIYSDGVIESFELFANEIRVKSVGQHGFYYLRNIEKLKQPLPVLFTEKEVIDIIKEVCPMLNYVNSDVIKLAIKNKINKQ